MSSARNRVAAIPPAGLPGLRPEWSRLVEVRDAAGQTHTWHVLDSDPSGTGDRVLLCVHGNPTWSYLWRALVADPPPGWRVIAPDHLGMGYSQGTEQPRTAAQRIADLGDLTAALGVRGPVITVGHDWGGAISLGWATQHRADLRAVILTNTAVALTEADAGPALIRLANAPGVRKFGCAATPIFVRATTALSRPALPRPVRDAFAAPYRSAARRSAVADFVADIPFQADHPSAPAIAQVAEDVRSLEVPALLLWGPRDPVFSERYLADVRERLPHAQLHRYEGASHLVTEDAPQYAQAVRDFVADLDAAPASADPAPKPLGKKETGTILDRLRARSDDTSVCIAQVAGPSVTWSELAGRVDRFAAGLAAAGVRPGDRVAFLVPPSGDLTASVYAVWRAGAVAVVVDRGLGLPGMRRALRGASVRHVIGTATGLAAAAAMGLPGSRFLAEDASGPLPAAATRLATTLGARTLADVEALGEHAPAPPLPTTDMECAVLFTSGATGPAKGVVYRHAQASAQGEVVRTAYGLGEGDRLVAAFAPFALLGPALGVATVVPAIDVTAPHTLTAPLLADAVAALGEQGSGATVVFAAPAALRTVAATAADVNPQQRAALGSVRLLMSAGAPVPAALLREVLRVLPNAEAHTPYGMTEALPVTDVSLAEIDAAGPGSGVCVGRPLLGVEVRISALDAAGAATGTPAETADVVGEIVVRGAHVKDHYDALWATQRASTRDAPGWHRTGDVGHLDEAGRLWVDGRLAHVVTTPAGPLTPVGIEQRIEACPGISAAAFVGVGPAGTQAPVVVVVPKASAGSGAARATRPRLSRRVRDRLGLGGSRLRPADLELTDSVRAAAGVPVVAVLVTDALPVDIRHASKVDRTALARAAARVLAGRGAPSAD